MKKLLTMACILSLFTANAYGMGDGYDKIERIMGDDDTVHAPTRCCLHDTVNTPTSASSKGYLEREAFNQAWTKCFQTSCCSHSQTDFKKLREQLKSSLVQIKSSKNICIFGAPEGFVNCFRRFDRCIDSSSTSHSDCVHEATTYLAGLVKACQFSYNEDMKMHDELCTELKNRKQKINPYPRSRAFNKAWEAAPSACACFIDKYILRQKLQKLLPTRKVVGGIYVRDPYSNEPGLAEFTDCFKAFDQCVAPYSGRYDPNCYGDAATFLAGIVKSSGLDPDLAARVSDNLYGRLRRRENVVKGTHPILD